MADYEVKLKRKAVEVITMTVNGNKFMLNDSADLFDAPRTTSVITAIIDMMEAEGLEWVRVQENP